MPNWETFKVTGGRGVYEKRASLSVRGVFTLNQPTFEELGKPESVELLYDREDELIGMKPSTAEVPYAYAVRKQGANKSYLIGARPFCYHYKIDLDHTVRFRNIRIDDGVLVLDLKSTVPVELKRASRNARASQGNVEGSVDE